MSNLKIIGVAVGGTLSVGATGIGLAWQSSNTTISKELEDYLLATDGNEDEWKSLQKKLNTHQGIINDSSLIGLSSIQKKTESEPSGGSELKTWCSNNYNKRINLLFSSKDWKDLYEYVKQFCVLTIKEKISQEKEISTEGETGKAEWQSRFDDLSKYSGNSNGDLTLKLEKIKQGQKDIHWKDLRDWCKSIYSLGYKSSNNNYWKLSDKFCKKP